MAGMVPYSDYEKALRRAWPFGAFDDFFAPLAAISADGAFKMKRRGRGRQVRGHRRAPGRQEGRGRRRAQRGQALHLGGQEGV